MMRMTTSVIGHQTPVTCTPQAPFEGALTVFVDKFLDPPKTAQTH